MEGLAVLWGAFWLLPHYRLPLTV